MGQQWDQEANKNEDTTIQNLWDTGIFSGAILREKFTAKQAYPPPAKKEKKKRKRKEKKGKSSNKWSNCTLKGTWRTTTEKA